MTDNNSYDESIEDLIYGNDSHKDNIERLKRENQVLSSLDEGMEK
jgi:hypothetical protein